MKNNTDRYTKMMLTIIALCLTTIVFKQIDIIPIAHANDIDYNQKPTYINYGLVPVNDDGSISVRLSPSSTMDVHIESVDAYAFRYCTVPVKIE